MKILLVLCTILLISCGEQQEKKALPTVLNSVESIDSIIVADPFNYRDQMGRKQGKWITKTHLDNSPKIEHYINDTLDGYFWKHQGMESDGYYIMGKEDSLWRTYYPKKKGERCMSISFFKNGVLQWSACPASDSKHVFPRKGMRTNLDSIYVKVPYSNEQLWYEGWIGKGRVFKGVHKMYHLNGNLKARVDYSNLYLVEYNSKGDTIYSGPFGSYRE